LAAFEDRFVVATFALWAGDFETARALLEQIEQGEPGDNAHRDVRSTLAEVARFRLRQLELREQEFKDIQLSLADGDNLSPVPVTGERAFELFGFPTDLDWAEVLFSRVAAITGGSPSSGDGKGPLGGTWVYPGNPFVQVSVSDMGLVEASSLWTGEGAPPDFAPFRLAFRRLLDDLDGQPIPSVTQRELR
jgi:hypothetical protein